MKIIFRVEIPLNEIIKKGIIGAKAASPEKTFDVLDIKIDKDTKVMVIDIIEVNCAKN